MIDVVDNVGRANGMVAVPTLFGLSLEEKEERVFKEGTAAPIARKRDIDPKRVTYVEHDDPFGVDHTAVPILQKLSANAWVSQATERADGRSLAEEANTSWSSCLVGFPLPG